MKASHPPKGLSSPSFATFSTSCTATTDSSAIWGPGGLSGRAIEAFGDATLRGIENIIIRRKLATYRALFPHMDDTPIRNIDSIYENVLELSRPKHYSKNTTRVALQLIMTQIAGRETHHLRKGLLKWTVTPRKYFLSQIMNASMEPYEERRPGVSSKENPATSRNGKDLIPIIDFIAFIAENDASSCQAALDGGFLDMLLRIYIFLPRLKQGRSALVSSCTSALLVLSRQPRHLNTIIHHPVCALWSICWQLVRIPAITDDSFLSRFAAWRRTDKSCVVSRLITIHKSLLSASNLKLAAAMDMCVDLVEFSRSQFYDPEVIELTILAMFRCILIGGYCTRHLITALTGASHQDTVNIFSRIIRLWLQYVQNRDKPSVPLHLQAGTTDRSQRIGTSERSDQSITIGKSFYTREKTSLFRKIETAQRRTSPLDDRPLHNIIKFVITAAKHSMTIRWGILDAGVLALVPLAIVDGVAPLRSGLLDMLDQQSHSGSPLSPQHRHTPGAEGESRKLDGTVIPLAPINAGASMLLRRIRRPQFEELLCSEMFVTRRSICCSLLEVLLGNERAVDDTYTKTHDLFTQILAERDIITLNPGSGNSKAPEVSSTRQPPITSKYTRNI